MRLDARDFELLISILFDSWTDSDDEEYRKQVTDLMDKVIAVKIKLAEDVN